MDDCELIELAPAHTNADWRPEAIQFFDGSKADPANFEGASPSFAMRIVGSNDDPSARIAKIPTRPTANRHDHPTSLLNQVR